MRVKKLVKESSSLPGLFCASSIRVLAIAAGIAILSFSVFHSVRDSETTAAPSLVEALGNEIRLDEKPKHEEAVATRAALKEEAYPPTNFVDSESEQDEYGSYEAYLVVVESDRLQEGMYLRLLEDAIDGDGDADFVNKTHTANRLKTDIEKIDLITVMAEGYSAEETLQLQ